MCLSPSTREAKRAAVLKNENKRGEKLCLGPYLLPWGNQRASAGSSMWPTLLSTSPTFLRRELWLRLAAGLGSSERRQQQQRRLTGVRRASRDQWTQYRARGRPASERVSARVCVCLSHIPTLFWFGDDRGRGPEQWRDGREQRVGGASESCCITPGVRACV